MIAAAIPSGAGATAARPASASNKPKVLRLVATGFGVDLTPITVGAARYTVQVHNIGEYTVRVTIGRLLDVVVPPGGWQFRDVQFKPSATYNVRAVAPLGHLSWNAVLTSQ